jgi:outer membrane immunogenic protein
MKRSSLALCVLLVSSVSALAEVIDWTGSYGGLSFALPDGDQDYGPDGVTDYTLTGTEIGFFGGYSWSRGNLIYGAELALSAADIYEVSPNNGGNYNDQYEFRRFFDLKARIGYPKGKMLFFGSVGLTSADFLYSGSFHIETTGYVVSLGADYAVSERFFVGAEVSHRELSAGEVGIRTNLNTFAVRGGLSF